MKLYCVDPPGTEDGGEGEDRTEWFSSLAAARKAFTAWKASVREDAIGWRWDAKEERYVHPISGETAKVNEEPGNMYRGSVVTLTVFEFAYLPCKELALAILNRKGYVKSQKVLETYDANEDPYVQRANGKGRSA